MMPVSPWAMVSWISAAEQAPLVGDARLAGLDEELGVQARVLRQGLFETGVGGLQFGDGVDLGAGVLGLPGVDLCEDEDEGAVQGEEDAEGRPVRQRVRRETAAALGARHGDGGGQHPDACGPLGEEARRVEVAEEREHGEERVAPGQYEGEDRAYGEVELRGPRPPSRPVAAPAPPELERQRHRDQHPGHVHPGTAHDEVGGHRRDDGGQPEQTVRPEPVELFPPLLGRGDRCGIPAGVPRSHGGSLPRTGRMRYSHLNQRLPRQPQQDRPQGHHPQMHPARPAA